MAAPRDGGYLGGMYEIRIEECFAASHAIRLPDGGLEPVHGHNWQVTVAVRRDGLDAIETVMDFHALAAIVKQILAPFHNRHLNEIAPFVDGQVSPTAERVAWWVGTQTARRLPPEVRLAHVRITEAPGCSASYCPDQP